MTSILDPRASNYGGAEDPDDELYFDGPRDCPVCGAKGGSCREEAMLRSGLMDETKHPTGVRIVRLHDERGPMYKLTEKTYVNRDSTKVAKEGSVEAAFLLGMPGDEISEETATRLGLVGGAGEAKSKYESMKVPELEAAIAERDDVDEPASGRKADLIAALEAADAKGNETSTEGGTTDQGEEDATDGTKQANGPAEA